MESNVKVFELMLDRLSRNILDTARTNLWKNGSVYTGRLLNSGHIVSTPLTREIVFDAPEAEWTEYGTQPHPVGERGRKALATWAMIKLNMNQKEAESFSWAEAKTIQLNGMEAHPFLRPAIDEVFTKEGLI